MEGSGVGVNASSDAVQLDIRQVCAWLRRELCGGYAQRLSRRARLFWTEFLGNIPRPSNQ